MATAGRTGPYPATDPRTALDAMPRVPDQRSGIRARLAQLADLPGWPAAAGAVPGLAPATDATGGVGGADVPGRLAGIVEAAVLRHGTHGYANPVMLARAATAPAAVLRALPALPGRLWRPSLAAAWGRLRRGHRRVRPGPARTAAHSAPALDLAGALGQAVDSGDAHAIKFADAAVDLVRPTPASPVDPVLPATIAQATTQIAED